MNAEIAKNLLTTIPFNLIHEIEQVKVSNIVWPFV